MAKIYEVYDADGKFDAMFWDKDDAERHLSDGGRIEVKERRGYYEED